MPSLADDAEYQARIRELYGDPIDPIEWDNSIIQWDLRKMPKRIPPTAVYAVVDAYMRLTFKPLKGPKYTGDEITDEAVKNVDERLLDPNYVKQLIMGSDGFKKAIGPKFINEVGDQVVAAKVILNGIRFIDKNRRDVKNMKQRYRKADSEYENFAIGMIINPEKKPYSAFAKRVANAVLKAGDQMGLSIHLDDVYDDIDSSDTFSTDAPFGIYLAEFSCEPIRELDLVDVLKAGLKKFSTSDAHIYTIEGEGPTFENGPEPSWVQELTDSYDEEEGSGYYDDED
jgi:hypothetical protein